MTLVEIAKRVRRGAALLDKRIPNWRTIMRKHVAQYDFADGDCCVLGTLEHHSGILRTIKSNKARQLAEDGVSRHTVAAAKLGINAREYGFDNVGGVDDLPRDPFNPKQHSSKVLHALWLAEFQQ